MENENSNFHFGIIANSSHLFCKHKSCLNYEIKKIDTSHSEWPGFLSKQSLSKGLAWKKFIWKPITGCWSEEEEKLDKEMEKTKMWVCPSIGLTVGDWCTILRYLLSSLLNCSPEPTTEERKERSMHLLALISSWPRVSQGWEFPYSSRLHVHWHRGGFHGSSMIQYQRLQEQAWLALEAGSREMLQMASMPNYSRGSRTGCCSCD